jgi:ribonuclease P protein component
MDNVGGNVPKTRSLTRNDRLPATKFARSLRLLKHADFRRVYDDGKRLFSPHMTAFFLARGAGGPRIGFTVGKMLGGAVERNRIKRRMREAVRRECYRLPAPVDVVFNPKKSVAQLDFEELSGEVSRTFQKIADKSGERVSSGISR